MGRGHGPVPMGRIYSIVRIYILCIYTIQYSSIVQYRSIQYSIQYINYGTYTILYIQLYSNIYSCTVLSSIVYLVEDNKSGPLKPQPKYMENKSVLVKPQPKFMKNKSAPVKPQKYIQKKFNVFKTPAQVELVARGVFEDLVLL